MPEKEYCVSFHIKAGNDVYPDEIVKDLKTMYGKIHTDYLINQTHVDVVKDSVFITES